MQDTLQVNPAPRTFPGTGMGCRPSRRARGSLAGGVLAVSGGVRAMAPVLAAAAWAEAIRGREASPEWAWAEASPEWAEASAGDPAW